MARFGIDLYVNRLADRLPGSFERIHFIRWNALVLAADAVAFRKPEGFHGQTCSLK
jgi:hypothetical protein